MTTPASSLDSRLFYESLFEHGADGVIFGKPDGSIVRANPAACRMLGHSEADLIRIGRAGLTRDGPALRELIATRREKGAVTGVLDFRRADGSTFPVEVTSIHVPDPAAEPLTCTTFRDVTERQRKAQELAASEELFRVAFDSASVGKALMAPDGHPLRVNRALCEMLGYPEHELLAVNWRAITHPDDLDATARVIDRAKMGQGVGGRLEKRFLRKDGSVVWADATTRAVLGAGGAVQHFITSIVDINDRKLAEEALRESERRFRLLADVAPVGIQLFGAHGDGLFVNELWSAMTGLSGAENFDRAKRTEAIHPEDRDRVLRGWWEAAAGRDFSQEFRMTSPDGRERWVRGMGKAIRDASGVASGYIGVMVDITESRAIQKQLAMASHLAAMGTLVAGVAHEINNPLAAELADQGVALEVVREVKDRLRGTSPIDRKAESRALEGVVEALQDAQEAGGRIATIVKYLTVFGRSDATRHRVRLAEIVEGARRRLPEAVSRTASIVVEDRGAPDVVAAAGQIEQVLVNLLTNAARATPEGQRDTVIVRVGAGTHGMARVDVIDHGGGIDPVIRDRIFDPFFTTMETGQGMGLGLPVCYAIATAHGGTITVESEVGKGSTFRLELPAAPAEA